ncbi:hypothetical protein G7H20_002834 [Salmonella enterica subsp. enterica serovar 4,[5],12:i:-]|nr:hypothetical protein [Salmonella enterica subsp. enterica serovar 4,[5],12:i:-]EHI3365787.1 hypothetical protein [Salmonella enterica]EIO8837267.1 hypothetical protein [Salmonella enterica]
MAHLSLYLEVVAEVLGQELEEVVSADNQEGQGRLLVKMPFLECQDLEVLAW